MSSNNEKLHIVEDEYFNNYTPTEPVSISPFIPESKVKASFYDYPELIQLMYLDPTVIPQLHDTVILKNKHYTIINRYLYYNPSTGKLERIELYCKFFR